MGEEPTTRARDRDDALTGRSGADAWPRAFAVFVAHLRRGILAIVALALLGAVLGALVKAALPAKFTATAQLLIDPRNLQVFSNEMVNSQLDANSAVNFVESQMQILMSERVLARVIRTEGLADDPAFRPARDGTGRDAVKLRPGLGPDGALVDPAALAALRRALVVKRGDRSFLVDVTATARTADLAARIANGTIKAFIEEDAATRADAGGRLTDELTNRLAGLRERLNESENRAEDFRTQNGLVVTGDRLIVEQKLEEAVTELGAVQGRVARAAAKVEQFDTAKRDLGSLGALTATEDMRTVSFLIERLSAARENFAELSLKLGSRHPELASARSRVEEVELRIRGELDRIREAAKVDLARMKGEQDALSRRATELSAEVARARQARIRLGALEEEVKANRGLLTSFETRSREANEFGRIAAINLRIASFAQPATASSFLVGAALWSVLGGVMGVMAAVGAIALWAMISLGKPDAPRPAARPETYGAPRAAAGAVSPGPLSSGRPRRDILKTG